MWPTPPLSPQVCEHLLPGLQHGWHVPVCLQQHRDCAHLQTRDCERKVSRRDVERDTGPSVHRRAEAWTLSGGLVGAQRRDGWGSKGACWVRRQRVVAPSASPHGTSWGTTLGGGACLPPAERRFPFVQPLISAVCVAKGVVLRCRLLASMASLPLGSVLLSVLSHPEGPVGSLQSKHSRDGLRECTGGCARSVWRRPDRKMQGSWMWASCPQQQSRGRLFPGPSADPPRTQSVTSPGSPRAWEPSLESRG